MYMQDLWTVNNPPSCCRPFILTRFQHYSFRLLYIKLRNAHYIYIYAY